MLRERLCSADTLRAQHSALCAQLISAQRSRDASATGAAEAECALAVATSDAKTKLALLKSEGDAAYELAESKACVEFSRVATALDADAQTAAAAVNANRSELASTQARVEVAQQGAALAAELLAAAQGTESRVAAFLRDLKQRSLQATARRFAADAPRREEEAHEAERDADESDSDESAGPEPPQRLSGSRRLRPAAFQLDAGRSTGGAQSEPVDPAAKHLRVGGTRSKSTFPAAVRGGGAGGGAGGGEAGAPPTVSGVGSRKRPLAAADPRQAEPPASDASSSPLLFDSAHRSGAADSVGGAGRSGRGASRPQDAAGFSTEPSPPLPPAPPRRHWGGRAAGGDPDDEGGWDNVSPAPLLPPPPLLQAPAVYRTPSYQPAGRRTPVQAPPPRFEAAAAEAPAVTPAPQPPGRSHGGRYGVPAPPSAVVAEASRPPTVAAGGAQWASNTGWQAQLAGAAGQVATRVPSAPTSSRPAPPGKQRPTALATPMTAAGPGALARSSSSGGGGASRSLTLGGTTVTVSRMPMHSSHAPAPSSGDGGAHGGFDFDDFDNDGSSAPQPKSALVGPKASSAWGTTGSRH